MKASASGDSTPITAGSSSGDHFSGSTYVAMSGVASAALTSKDDASHSTGGGDNPDGVVFAFYTEQVIPFENFIRGITRFGGTFGLEEDYNYLGINVGIGVVNFRSGSLPDQAVENPLVFDLGLAYRRYFTEPHTFFSPYLTAGLYAQVLRWEYRNAVVIGGDVISVDAVGGGGGFLGLGTTIIRGERLSFFGEARVGQTWFDSETSQGFYNNVLDNHGYYSFNLGLSLRF